TLDLGQNVTLAANVIGGSGGYTYTWIGLPPGCDGTTATLHCTPSTPAATGVFPIRVLVTDSNGYAAPSPATNVTVSSDPTVTLSATPESVNFGQAHLRGRGRGRSGPVSVRVVRPPEGVPDAD